MSNESGFKLIITNQSNKDRIIRLVISILLIATSILVNIGEFYSIIAISISGVLLFNAISGNCYIYRVFGINTCPLGN